MEKDKLIQQIYHDLEADIVHGLYPIDSKLPSERELSIKYDATRIVIREAIAMLTQSGLVETRPQKGTFIKDFYTELSLDSLINIIRISKNIDVKNLKSVMKFFSSSNIEQTTENSDKDISENLKRIEAAIVRKKLYDESQILSESDYEMLYEFAKICFDPLSIAITVSLKPLCLFISKIAYTISDVKEEIYECDVKQFKALNTHAYDKATKFLKEKISIFEKALMAIDKIENGKIFLSSGSSKKSKIFDM